MKFGDGKRYLRPHSIHRERATTINGAFAAAIVPMENYDKDRLLEALKFLGQPDPEGDLKCIYCGTGEARTWDHLIPIVKASKPNGPGHQIGNLVPACKDCNSRKRNKDWREFLISESLDEIDREALIDLLTRYQEKYLFQDPHAIDDSDPRWRKFDAIRLDILRLMKEADIVAAEIREARLPSS